MEIKGEVNCVDPIIEGEEIYRIIDEEDYAEAQKIWKNSIYIYMAGKRPYVVHLNAYIKRVRNPKGAWDVFPRHNGFYLIKFDKEETLIKF